MRISMLVACSTNNVIGRDGDLPWRLSADLKHFKRLTMGHPILMGRKTLQSIGRLLPGRTTIVMTRDPEFQFEGAHIARDWQAACEIAANHKHEKQPAELFVVGGAQIYELAMPAANRLYLTRVHAEISGDTFFPEYDSDAWNVVSREDHVADEKNEYCLLYTSPSPRDATLSRMPSSA